VRSSSETAECLLAQRLPPILQKFNEEKANMRKHYHEIVIRSSSSSSDFLFIFDEFFFARFIPHWKSALQLPRKSS
jgi:hypothetical protein